ncbi:hypothetical protein A45J_2714 [hot springs metagenome]|uniref:DUF4031 domain-containing protein n=1 Tax=hot springs metagenome TaxID=433727 RepID=A0A5J4KZC0_9ZZZZ
MNQIYTDRTHLITTGHLEGLHAFAQSIGLKREWFQGKGRFPHYDLTTPRASARAQQAGAILINPKDLIKLLNGRLPGISFTWTTPAFLSKQKSVTRRDWPEEYAKRFKEGDLLFAYDKQARFGGSKIGIIQLIADPSFESMSKMPDGDYEAEGFKYLYENPHLLPRSMKIDVSWEGFNAWRNSGGSKWVIRFRICEILNI